MREMRVRLVPLIVAMLAASPAAAEEVWSLDGLQAPESVLLDAERNVLYVSNIGEGGDPTAKDGNGYISKVSLEGAMQEAEWVTGFDAPKGLIMADNTLYVADIDKLIAIDVESGEISGTWTAEGAEFLNDTAVDSSGRVFVSDMATHRIYALENDAISVFLEDPGLMHPNGLHAEEGRLVVAAWGQEMQPDFTTKVPGHLIAVDLATKAISEIGTATPTGNLDGLEPDGAGNWLATDWIGGGLYRIGADGTPQELLDLDQGSADLEYIAAEKLAIIPMMLDGRIVAHRLE